MGVLAMIGAGGATYGVYAYSSSSSNPTPDPPKTTVGKPPPYDPCTAGPRPAPLAEYRATRIPLSKNHGSAIDLDVRDMDRDGIPDIVVARGGFDPGDDGVLTVIYGPHDHVSADCATGLHDVTAARVVDSLTHGPLGRMRVGDVDGDGCDDVVVGNFAGGVELFRGEKRDGGRCELGRTAAHLPLESTRDPRANGKSTVGVAAVELEDLDEDGDLDLALARINLGAGGEDAVQQVYWNEGGRFTGAPWESSETIRGAFSVRAVRLTGHAPDVIFGMNHLCPKDAPTEQIGGWGAHHVNHGGGRLDPDPIALRHDGDPGAAASPAVVDLRVLGSAAPPRLLVASSHHQCASVACGALARLRVYERSDGGMAPTPRFASSLMGDWLPAGVGDLDDDGADDVAAGLACGRRNQNMEPGFLVVYQSREAETDGARSFDYADGIIRATTIADVDAPDAGSTRREIVFGTRGGASTNDGAVVILTRCSSH